MEVKRQERGRWAPGQSGNPEGRPPLSEKRRSFEQICKEAAEELVPVLVDAVQDVSISLKDRAAAFELLAQNGFGVPVARSIHVSLSAGGNAEGIPREALEARAAALLTRTGEVVSEQ